MVPNMRDDSETNATGEGAPTPVELSDEERLKALERTGSMHPESEEAFDRITRMAVRLLDISAAFITLLDDECQIIKSLNTEAPHLEVDREVPLAYSYCKTVVARRSPVVVSDVTKEPMFEGHPATEAFPIRGYVGVPLMTNDGHVLGSVCASASESASASSGWVETRAGASSSTVSTPTT